MLEKQETSHNHETSFGLIHVEELRTALRSGWSSASVCPHKSFYTEINVSLVALLLLHRFPSEHEAFSASGPAGNEEVSSW